LFLRSYILELQIQLMVLDQLWHLVRLFTIGMSIFPFCIKRRSPLDPVSSRTLIVLVFSFRLVLTSLWDSLVPVWLALPRSFARSSRKGTFWRNCQTPQFSALFADFWRSLANGFRLVLRELHSLSFERYITATTAVTLPVFVFSIVISLALMLSESKLVTLIGRVSEDV